MKVRISGMVFTVRNVSPARDGYIWILFQNYAHLRYHVSKVELL